MGCKWEKQTKIKCIIDEIYLVLLSVNLLKICYHKLPDEAFMIMFFEAFDVYKTESASKRFCLYFNISTDFF